MGEGGARDRTNRIAIRSGTIVSPFCQLRTEVRWLLWLLWLLSDAVPISTWPVAPFLVALRRTLDAPKRKAAQPPAQPCHGSEAEGTGLDALDSQS